ncbi:MAG: LLM class flavin-dependent oxidoreductase, partial [Actinobacteria bacterium]|nr:LLM class flavin-dependent oxidoreductase [Actinomycetota bacterium]
MQRRDGMTVPLPGHLHEHEKKICALADLGYTDIWSAEADGVDAFTPLALAAAWEPRLRLGTAIVPAYTRTPALFAQSVASLADAAPGRFAIG